ncbi:MAG: tRNA (adenosine(37)-N6)-threonylcarbamoyltransferase complex dimerization subunit type 1 TsaB [Chloroflexota bacterium]|nr:tRNA (adenosine(37)-N6)-threonylcarbamoyltransferase complex dimerization subunit type 1 TsaB [Chloroflexota bacterium]
MQLAIDTSTDVAGLALSCDGKVKAELVWCCERGHTVELWPNLTRLMDMTSTDIRSIDTIVVAKGPGSFNGLRVGLSAAKGIAFCLNASLIGIGTLEVEAYPFASSGFPICPIHNAGRGEIATALYRMGISGWHCMVEEGISTMDVLCAQTNEKTIFCGEPSPAMEEELVRCLGDIAIIPSVISRLRRPGHLAELGWHRLQMGQLDDPGILQPLYLRQPPITKPKHKTIKK